MVSGDSIGNLRLLSVIIGLVLVAAAVSQLFISVPYLTRYSGDAIKYVPLGGQTVSWLLFGIGVLLVIVGLAMSQMGKYFQYY